MPPPTVTCRRYWRISFDEGGGGGRPRNFTSYNYKEGSQLAGKMKNAGEEMAANSRLMAAPLASAHSQTSGAIISRQFSIVTFVRDSHFHAGLEIE